MHFFDSSFEALATHGIHRDEGECLRERHTICAPMQKFYMRIHFAKDRTEHNFPERSLRNGSLYKQSRPPGQ